MMTLLLEPHSMSIASPRWLLLLLLLLLLAVAVAVAVAAKSFWFLPRCAPPESEPHQCGEPEFELAAASLTSDARYKELRF